MQVSTGAIVQVGDSRNPILKVDNLKLLAPFSVVFKICNMMRKRNGAKKPQSEQLQVAHSVA